MVPAEHGRRALEVLDEQPVDAILTDLQMPVMDGLTLLGHLLERGFKLPVAVMTGHAITAELRDRLQRYGIAATFTKPVDISFLADELQRCLNPATVGRIAGITLFGFLQLIEVERKTGLIVVASAGQEGRLYFDRGHLVHAESRGLHGVEAVYEIVSWTDPKLEIFYKRTPRERTISDPLQHILMEAARLLDERGREPHPSVGASAPSHGAAGEAGAALARPPAPKEWQAANVPGALEEALQIDGALGVALVHGASGMTLGTAGGATLNLELAAAGAADVVRAELRASAKLRVDDALEDMIITLGKHYHLMRCLDPGQQVFLYLVLDRARGNLGMARHKLAAIGRRLTV